MLRHATVVSSSAFAVGSDLANDAATHAKLLLHRCCRYGFLVGQDAEQHASEDGEDKGEEGEEGEDEEEEEEHKERDAEQGHEEEKEAVKVKQEDAVEEARGQEASGDVLQTKQEPDGSGAAEDPSKAATTATGACSDEGAKPLGAATAAAETVTAAMEEEALGSKPKAAGGDDEEEEAKVLNDASRDALAAQPTGYTLATSKVRGMLARLGLQ
jgi:hypothetical protein